MAYGRVWWLWTLVLGTFVCMGEASLNSKTVGVPAAVENPDDVSFDNILIEKIGAKKLMVVSFVNGIFHTEADWQRIASILNNLFGEDVYPFYNPSSGSWTKDALGAGYQLFVKPSDFQITEELAHHLRQALKVVGPSGRVLHLAHSGGAILTYLAAKNYLTVAERQRIDVVTFGGGRSITRKYFGGGHLVNYYSRNDPLVMVDGRAGSLVKKAKAEDDFCEVRDSKHNTTFVFLKGIKNDPVSDHDMIGPTYVGALVQEARLFHERLRSMRETEVANAGLLRKLRKRMAQATGMHHFWHNTRIDAGQAVRAFRKSSAKATGMRGFFSGKMINILDTSGISSEEQILNGSRVIANMTTTENKSGQQPATFTTTIEQELSPKGVQSRSSWISNYWNGFFPENALLFSENHSDNQDQHDQDKLVASSTNSSPIVTEHLAGVSSINNTAELGDLSINNTYNGEDGCKGGVGQLQQERTALLHSRNEEQNNNTHTPKSEDTPVVLDSKMSSWIKSYWGAYFSEEVNENGSGSGWPEERT